LSGTATITVSHGIGGSGRASAGTSRVRPGVISELSSMPLSARSFCVDRP
jgi:hypothetical protein